MTSGDDQSVQSPLLMGTGAQFDKALEKSRSARDEEEQVNFSPLPGSENNEKTSAEASPGKNNVVLKKLQGQNVSGF